MHFFVKDDCWHEHNNAFKRFIKDNKNRKILFLELGAGFNTPSIIRYPFEALTYNLKDAYLIRINNQYAFVPNEIKEKALEVQDDIANVIKKLLS